MRAIHWTDEALDQVLRIKEYLAVTSPEYAERVVQNIINKAEQLIQFPKSGPVYAKAGLPQVRELLSSRAQIGGHAERSEASRSHR